MKRKIGIVILGIIIVIGDVYKRQVDMRAFGTMNGKKALDDIKASL